MKPSSSPSSALGNLLEDVHLAKLFSLFLNRLRAANRGRRVKVCAAIKPSRASIVLGCRRPLSLRKGGGASSITQSMPCRNNIPPFKIPRPIPCTRGDPPHSGRRAASPWCRCGSSRDGKSVWDGRWSRLQDSVSTSTVFSNPFESCIWFPAFAQSLSKEVPASSTPDQHLGRPEGLHPSALEGSPRGRVESPLWIPQNMGSPVPGHMGRVRSDRLHAASVQALNFSRRRRRSCLRETPRNRGSPKPQIGYSSDLYRIRLQQRLPSAVSLVCWSGPDRIGP